MPSIDTYGSLAGDRGDPQSEAINKALDENLNRQRTIQEEKARQQAIQDAQSGQPEKMTAQEKFEAKKAQKEAEKVDKETAKQQKKQTSVKDLYDVGIERIRALGYTIRLAPDGTHAQHHILKPQAPPEVKGITYPELFQPLQPIPADGNDLKTIQKDFQEQPGRTEPWQGLADFWEPLYRPTHAATDLANYTTRLLAQQADTSLFSENDPISYNQTFDPDAALTQRGIHNNPEVWVPATNWFSPELRKVEFKDIFGVFPDAERELLQIIIGRMGVGPQDTLPLGWTKPLKHTFRSAAVVLGGAGIGKSTLFKDGLVKAISKGGFRSATFRDTDARFGLGKVCRADLAYKDDTTVPTLKAFMGSEITKQMITGGTIETEEKFENSAKTATKPIFILIANKWDPKGQYDLDDGIIDRIKVLNIFSPDEIKMIEQGAEVRGFEGRTELSKRSPSLLPETHIAWLCEETNVSVEALFLWALRLATDKFWDLIKDKNKMSSSIAHEPNKLMIEVRRQTTRCRIRFKPDLTESIVRAMFISSALRHDTTKPKAKPWTMPELTKAETLVKGLNDLYWVFTDSSCYHLRDAMKLAWESADREPSHYWTAFKELNVNAVRRSVATFNNGYNLDQKSLNSVFIEVLEKLELRDGFKNRISLEHWAAAWQTVRVQEQAIKHQAEQLLEVLTEDEKTRLRNKKVAPTDEWVKSPDYSPELASEQAPDPRKGSSPA